MTQIRGSSTPPSNTSTNKSKEGSSKQDVKSKDADDFSKAMLKDGKKGKKESAAKKLTGELSGKQIKQEGADKSLNPEALLQNSKKKEPELGPKPKLESEDSALFDAAPTAGVTLQTTGHVTEASVKEVAMQKADTALLQRAEQVAEKIMVQTAKDVKEVNIKFNDKVLPGTEVNVRRDADGIKLEFMTTSADSLNFINKGEAVLTEALNKRFDGNISIEVNFQGSMEQSEDGSSRNEYIPDDFSDEDE